MILLGGGGKAGACLRSGAVMPHIFRSDPEPEAKAPVVM